MVERVMPRRHGFWAGLVLGFAIAVTAAALLALAFRPQLQTPPELAPKAAVLVVPAPAAPRAVIRTGTPGALLPDRPGAEMPSALPGLAPPVAPDVFEGQPSGSPSLMPPAGE